MDGHCTAVIMTSLAPTATHYVKMAVTTIYFVDELVFCNLMMRDRPLYILAPPQEWSYIGWTVLLRDCTAMLH